MKAFFKLILILTGFLNYIFLGAVSSIWYFEYFDSPYITFGIILSTVIWTGFTTFLYIPMYLKDSIWRDQEEIDQLKSELYNIKMDWLKRLNEK